MSETEDLPNLTDKQKRVLDAAMEVFAEKGYAAASTAEIAKRAGVAEGTVFKTFKTKKDLLLGVVAPFFVKRIAPPLLAEVKDIITAPHPRFEDFVRALYTNRIHFIRAHDRLVRIAFQEVPFHEEIRNIVKEIVLKEMAPHAVIMVRRFQELGQIRKDADPASVLRIVIGTFMAYAITSTLVVPEHPWDDDKEVELMISVVARGLAP
jgi:AcrR family transcriptional regulator